MKTNGLVHIEALDLVRFRPQHFRVRSADGHYLETGDGGVNSTWGDVSCMGKFFTEAEADDLIRRKIAFEKVPV